MKELNKTVKELISLHICYICIILYLTENIEVDYNFRIKEENTPLFIFPVFLYWLGVWCYGIGYIKRIIRKIFTKENIIQFFILLFILCAFALFYYIYRY